MRQLCPQSVMRARQLKTKPKLNKRGASVANVTRVKAALRSAPATARAFRIPDLARRAPVRSSRPTKYVSPRSEHRPLPGICGRKDVKDGETFHSLRTIERGRNKYFSAPLRVGTG